MDCMTDKICKQIIDCGYAIDRLRLGRTYKTIHISV